MRSNYSGDTLSFKYYDASEDAVLDIIEEYVFMAYEQIGGVENPVFYNISTSVSLFFSDIIDSINCRFSSITNSKTNYTTYH